MASPKSTARCNRRLVRVSEYSTFPVASVRFRTKRALEGPCAFTMATSLHEFCEVGRERRDGFLRDCLDEAAADRGDDAADLRIGVQCDMRLAARLGRGRDHVRRHAAAAACFVTL